VLLLPHGYEGQGPDHSSARIERFLTLFAEDNMTVAMPSTPASYFHLLRKQAYARPRRPLIVFTPKSMLRLKGATSDVQDFTTGTFEPVIGDRTVDPAVVDRVVLCSGKIYYDLLGRRTANQDERTAIVRVEQLAPLPVEQILAEVGRYPDASLTWAQQEPANQGPLPFMALNLPEHLGGRQLRRASRPASASPASGSAKRHEAELATLLSDAMDRQAGS
jgi:2-oxoglutarate dehydrogenase E1 component